MWNPFQTRSFIRQVSHSKSKRLDVSPLGPDVRALDMEIACIRSTVRTTIPLDRRCEAFIWKLLVAEVRVSDRAPQSGRGSNQERISVNFGKPIAQLSIWTAPGFYQARRSVEPANYKYRSLGLRPARIQY
jgi:hypothetical protein